MFVDISGFIPVTHTRQAYVTPEGPATAPPQNLGK